MNSAQKVVSFQLRAARYACCVLCSRCSVLAPDLSPGFELVLFGGDCAVFHCSPPLHSRHPQFQFSNLNQPATILKFAVRLHSHAATLRRRNTPPKRNCGVVFSATNLFACCRVHSASLIPKLASELCRNYLTTLMVSTPVFASMPIRSSTEI